ncbi:MAG: 50S ribosomal protein L29 [Deltaproteobacteria bacterium]|nr:MAG: 50S ribosomal protein L29 [Deltaproteobacteria bacterium]
MKKSEIKESNSIEDLQEKVVELSQELFNLRLQKSISQLQDTAKLGRVKKERARVLTRVNELKAAS